VPNQLDHVTITEQSIVLNSRYSTSKSGDGMRTKTEGNKDCQMLAKRNGAPTARLASQGEGPRRAPRWDDSMRSRDRQVGGAGPTLSI
jgi:hypothetical protein